MTVTRMKGPEYARNVQKKGVIKFLEALKSCAKKKLTPTSFVVLILGTKGLIAYVDPLVI